MRAAAFALALGAACAAPAAFSIDATSPISTPLNVPLLDCVGSGHGTLALRADYQQHLAAVQRDIGFKHIRGHGLLSDDMSALLPGPGTNVSLYNLFRAFDFYLSVGIKPIFELSFMPEKLAFDATKTIMHYKGITSAPRDFQKWGDFVQSVVQGCVDRYGLVEVRSWRFEVWNEPAACGFYCPPPGVTNIDSYFDLYEATARAVKAVDSFLSVGGPATAQLGWVSDFVNRTGAGALMPASFISTHSYPTDYRHDADMTRSSFEDGVIAAAQIAQAANLPFVLTEMSAGLNNAYDSYFAASFIAHEAAAFLGVINVPTMSFWTFTDIFEEPGMQSLPYAETFGMQTKWGVPKPSYRALQLLSRLPKTGLPITAAGAAPRRAGLGPAGGATATVGNVDAIAAIDASLGTTVAVALVTNFNLNIADTEDPTKGLPIQTEAGVTVTWRLPAGAVASPSGSVILIDNTHAWAKPAWLAAGSPLYPNASQIAAEMAASALVELPLAVTVAGATASVTLPDLVPYAVAYVRIEFAVAAA